MPPEPPAPALESLVDSYLDVLWHFDPVAATGAGLPAYDGRLGRFGAEGVREHLAALRAIAGSLEALAVDSLDDEIDRTALLNSIRATLYRFEHERPHERNPVFWLSHALEGLYLLTVFRDRTAEHRARAAAERLGQLPAFLDEAAATLARCPPVLIETAVRMLVPASGLIESVASEFGRFWDARERAAAEAARGALAGFRRELERDTLAGPADGYAIGEKAFDYRLHYEHALRATANELWRYGSRLVQEVEAELEALARRLAAGRSWMEVADRLRDEPPPADGLVAAYAAAMERARRFVAERALASLPDGALTVVETPGFLRPVIPFAAYQPPQVFASVHEGWFYVTSPAADEDDAAAQRLLRDHCAYELPWTALHEGYPGHHLQFLAVCAQPRRVRKVVSTPLTVEGWALYCEEMMAQEGFAEGPEELLFQKIALLWRAVRVVVDIGLHTREMTPQAAVQMLVDRVGFERALAEAEVRRYCGAPTYQLCYAVGRRELFALRDDYFAARGRSLRAFHDAVLSYGGLPVALMRWGLELDA